MAISTSPRHSDSACSHSNFVAPVTFLSLCIFIKCLISFSAREGANPLFISAPLATVLAALDVVGEVVYAIGPLPRL